MNTNPQDGFTNSVRRYTDLTVGKWLNAVGVSPNQVTLAGMTVCMIGSLLFALHLFWTGLAVFVFGATSDFIDGSVARVGNKRTPFGQQLDSFTDRIVETCMLAALAWATRHNAYLILGCFFALGGSFLVTYARLKAEAEGLKGDVGFGDRAVRMGSLGVSLLIGRYWGDYGLAVLWLNVLAWSTALHRILYVRQQLEGGTELTRPAERFIGLLTGLLTLSIALIYFGIDSPW